MVLQPNRKVDITMIIIKFTNAIIWRFYRGWHSRNSNEDRIISETSYHILGLVTRLIAEELPGLFRAILRLHNAGRWYLPGKD